jgi:hypothetical protein
MTDIPRKVIDRAQLDFGSDGRLTTPPAWWPVEHRDAYRNEQAAMYENMKSVQLREDLRYNEDLEDLWESEQY